ncbi:hypothetical protein [Hyphomonas sp.]|uniref:hypothetical protein n=1 Tax=Hyphomonas sp. TaxID=87 RepID=UPI001BCE3FC5|nr:hypothetical protein [Hyphomonas sp.]
MDPNSQLPEYYALNELLGRARFFILALVAFIKIALRRLPEHPSRHALGYITRRTVLLIASTLGIPTPRRPPARPPPAKAKLAPGPRPPPTSTGKTPGAHRALSETAFSLLRELTNAACRTLTTNTS